MPTFTPPLEDGPASIGGDSHPLWRHFDNYQVGATVWKDSLGAYHHSQFPYQGGFHHRTYDDTILTEDIDTSVDSLANATEVYMGGSQYEVTIAKANELIAAGFTFEWWQLTDFTHAWSARDSLVDNGRAFLVSDKRGSYPLIKLPGEFPLLGANLDTYGPLPGPLYIPSSARFNGRPALFTDPFPTVGSFFPLNSGLSPNGTLHTSTNDPYNWFNPPNGYSQPYWVAVLARLNDTGFNTAIWDAQNGGIGTGPTIGPDILGGSDDRWEVSLFGPAPIKLETTHISSADETVLVFVQVNGASSFLEVNWRDGAGLLQTERVTGTLHAHNYLECMLGWVHDTYWADAAIKLNLPTEDEMDFIRAWAAPYMPTAASLPAEP